MATFKQYTEEFRSNMPQSNPYDIDQLADMISDSTLLHLQLVIANEKGITVYQHDFGTDDRFIILTDRVKKRDIVGYMYIHKLKDDIWQVRDVTIFDPYKRRGLSLDLYAKLAKEGYKLINGFSLSSEIEKCGEN